MVSSIAIIHGQTHIVKNWQYSDFWEILPLRVWQLKLRTHLKSHNVQHPQQPSRQAKTSKNQRRRRPPSGSAQDSPTLGHRMLHGMASAAASAAAKAGSLVGPLWVVPNSPDVTFPAGRRALSLNAMRTHHYLHPSSSAASVLSGWGVSVQAAAAAPIVTTMGCVSTAAASTHIALEGDSKSTCGGMDSEAPQVRAKKRNGKAAFRGRGGVGGAGVNSEARASKGVTWMSRLIYNWVIMSHANESYHMNELQGLPFTLPSLNTWQSCGFGIRGGAWMETVYLGGDTPTWTWSQIHFGFQRVRGGLVLGYTVDLGLDHPPCLGRWKNRHFNTENHNIYCAFFSYF